MDVLRRQKDRSYKNVFKGSVLVGTLMDHDENKFATRGSAIKFAQKLLDAGHIESIVGSAVFEDSVHLYRWADETVVREAKKMVSTTSHIPRKKLIELVDMNQAELTDDTYDMKDVKDKLIAKFQAERPTPMTFATKEERRASRKERAARRKTLCAMQIGDAMDQLSNDPTVLAAAGRRTRAQDLERANNSTNLSRQASLSQENLGTANGYVSADEIGVAAMTTPVRRRRRRSPSRPESPQLGEQQLQPEVATDDVDVSSRQGRRERASARRASLSEGGGQVNGHSSEEGVMVNGMAGVTGIVNGVDNSDRSRDNRSANKPVLNSLTSGKCRGDVMEALATSSPAPSPPPAPCIEPSCDNQQSNNRTTSSDSNNNASSKGSKVEDAHKLNASEVITLAPPPGGDKEGDVSTCVYDGVEMAALDIEHLNFENIRPRPNESLVAINRSLESFSKQSFSYSDNEKQLLEQMKRMQTEHEKVVHGYEDRLTELLNNMVELRHLAGKMDTRNGLITNSGGQQSDAKTSSTSSVNGGLDDSSISSESDLLSTTLPTTVGVFASPPVPPPPPPPLGMPLPPSKIVKPSKLPIKTRLKMRPLFWNRIILDKKKEDHINKEKHELTFWHRAKETKFEVDAFEKLFGKADDEKTSRAKSLHDAMSSTKGKGRMQTAKILEDNRSRAVAIKLRSMHCQMSDIKQAVYNMEFTKIDLDSIFSLYQIKGTKSELDRISVHLQCHEDVALDQPEQFLWELSQMSHFPERIECMMLQKRFNETLFNIDQQLSTVEHACTEIRENTSLRTILETILAFGNYMNGSTQRGQADGFEYTILSKVKDVRSMDNSTNLLQYIVRTYMKDYEEDAGKDEAVFRLPDPAMMSQGAQVSFADLDMELNGLHHQLQSHSKKAQLVCLDTEAKLLQPFKDKMDDFFETADAMIKNQQDKLAETQAQFQSLLRYLAVKDTTEQTTPETMFSVWAQFCDSFKVYWKLEHKRIARMMFEKVEQKKRNRMRAARRRKSTVEDGKSNMKTRFAQLRRRSENVNPTVKMLRSQSLNENSQHAESDSDICGRSGNPEGEDGRRRRRRPQSEVYESEAVNYFSDASVTSTRSETMAERMQRRRRSRINSEEVQNNIQNARQENGSPQLRPRSIVEANGNSESLSKPGRRFHCTSNTEGGHGYSSDTDKLTRRWQHGNNQIDSEVFGVNTNNNSHEQEVMSPRRRRRPGVVSRDEPNYLSDAPTEVEKPFGRRHRVDNAGTSRYRGIKNSDSLTSLTDVARYKPAGDRTPIISASSQSTSQSSTSTLQAPYSPNRTFKQRSRYGQQYADPNAAYDGSDVARHSRTASPCGSTVSGHSPDYPTDLGAPPRPALPSSYNYRGQGPSDTDLMDTDQEKINYREAIRKMSGTRRRSTELKSQDINRRPQDISPMGRLR